MSNFNLKNYQKISGDEHIERRLRNEHGNIPNEINEGQLEKARATEPTELTEKQLEKVRSGGANEITEKRLDTDKAKFANSYRNPSAYEGDINKLEEKRLTNDPVEKEKYEDASETPKGLRWWDEAPKSPDGLKLAQKKNEKIAQSTEFLDSVEITGDISLPELPVGAAHPSKEEFSITEGAPADPNLYIIKQKYLSAVVPGVYIVLSYDPNYYQGNIEAIKQAAYERIEEYDEDLANLITYDDFSSPEEDGVEGTIALRVFGDKFAPLVEAHQTGGTPLAPDVFEEVSYEEKDVEGTPMVVGSVSINANVTENNKDNIVEEALAFINQSHEELNLQKESLDLSRLKQGQIGFAISAPIVAASLKEEFPIRDVTAQTSGIKKK